VHVTRLKQGAEANANQEVVHLKSIVFCALHLYYEQLKTMIYWFIIMKFCLPSFAYAEEGIDIVVCIS